MFLLLLGCCTSPDFTSFSYIQHEKNFHSNQLRPPLQKKTKNCGPGCCSQWRGQRFCSGAGSQRGSGAEPPDGSRAQCDKRSSGGVPLVPKIFFISSVQISWVALEERGGGFNPFKFPIGFATGCSTTLLPSPFLIRHCLKIFSMLLSPDKMSTTG